MPPSTLLRGNFIKLWKVQLLLIPKFYKHIHALFIPIWIKCYAIDRSYHNYIQFTLIKSTGKIAMLCVWYGRVCAGWREIWESYIIQCDDGYFADVSMCNRFEIYGKKTNALCDAYLFCVGYAYDKIELICIKWKRTKKKNRNECFLTGRLSKLFHLNAQQNNIIRDNRNNNE